MHVTARRTTILVAAEALVRQYGHRKTSISDIAERARIAVGSVYLEFPSKNALLEALSHTRHERVLAEVESALGGRGSYETRVRRALDARAKAFLAYACEASHEAELVHCACDGVKAAHAHYRDREHALFAKVLAEGTAKGELAARDASASARALLLAYEAFAPPLVFTHTARDASALDALHDSRARGSRAPTRSLTGSRIGEVPARRRANARSDGLPRALRARAFRGERTIRSHSADEAMERFADMRVYPTGPRG